jgi:hypothetical protein
MNMRLLFGIVLLSLLLFGCAQEGQPAEEQTSEQPVVEENETVEVEEVQAEEETEDEVPGIIEVPDKEDVIEQKEDSGPAGDQQDCATMSADCESCIAKQGCGWCKTSNSCFIGNEAGPSVSTCEPGDWTFDVSQCEGPKGGGTCEAQYNCADCLTGTGCKWCIQGSVCVSADSTEECFGGWLTESFRCNYASR